MNDKTEEKILALIRERTALQRQARPLLELIHGIDNELKILCESYDKERKDEP